MPPKKPQDLAQHLGYQRMWERFPEKNNGTSSVWWFFLLTPKQKEGFGPKQMMFVLVSRAGDEVNINGKWHKGLTVDKSPQPEHSQLDGMAISWINDGETLHENLVLEPGKLNLDKNKGAWLWSEQENGEMYGGEMKKSAGTKPFSTQVHFNGKNGYGGTFEAWGDPSHHITSPDDVLDINRPFGGSRVVAWKHLNFAGTFSSPSGTEELEGIGYFQRVCLDVMPFPWKWIWGAFEDESVFSFFSPYVGLNAFRRGDWFFPNALEQPAIHFMSSAYISLAGDRDPVNFEKVSVTPVITRSEYPEFLVDCHSANGDYLKYRILPHNHAQVLLDRKVLGGAFKTRYNYNEYLFRMGDLEGMVRGKPINESTVGKGWGNIEYTWGLGL